MDVWVSVQEAELDFASVLGCVRQGEEITLAEDGEPVARLTPVPPRPKRRVPGSAKGFIVLAPDFDDPLPEAILKE